MACLLIGLPRDRITGQDQGRFFQPSSAGTCGGSSGQELADQSEKDLVTGDGKRISIIEHAVPLTLGGRPCLLVTFIDNRERKKAMTDLISLNRKLQILSTVTRNDILSELFGLAGYLQLLREENPGLSHTAILEKLNWVMGRLQAKTQFFRDFEKAGSKGPVWVDLTGVVEKAWQSASLSHVSLSADLRGVQVFADPMIEKVFFNLFDNTRRHGGHATTVRLSYHKINGGLLIVYEDNGVGIPKEEKERIFGRCVGTHTGLGLFFVREVLAITCISIRETGIPGSGARFEITVPQGTFTISDTGT